MEINRVVTMAGSHALRTQLKRDRIHVSGSHERSTRRQS
jgi:hypothetical protein